MTVRPIYMKRAEKIHGCVVPDKKKNATYGGSDRPAVHI